MGNPTSYYNGTRWSFTWGNGRSLTAASGGGKTLSFTYDLQDGTRSTKTVGTEVHNYIYAGGKLLRETYGNTTLDFIYDVNGRPYAMIVNESTTYYYITNLQGDVINVVNSSGTTVASYEYDPYGYPVTQNEDGLGFVNPLRYRGYYWDTETEMYYLQSRYYDPAVGRFINADSYASTGQGITGNNMFTYCLNNPVNKLDSMGNVAIAISFGYDVTLGFFGVSASFSFVIDDDMNIAVQASYSAPTYIDPETYHTGLADAGIAASIQITDDDTVYDLEGPGCYGGFSAGAGPSFGVDMVYSGVRVLNKDQADEFPNGIAVSAGFGVGIDAHFKQTTTTTIWSKNLRELLD